MDEDEAGGDRSEEQGVSEKNGHGVALKTSVSDNRQPGEVEAPGPARVLTLIRERPSARKAEVDFVPPRDLRFAEPPAEIHFPTVFPTGEVDKAHIGVFQFDAQLG
jgi:hypothetical protein